MKLPDKQINNSRVWSEKPHLRLAREIYWKPVGSIYIEWEWGGKGKEIHETGKGWLKKEGDDDDDEAPADNNSSSLVCTWRFHR